MNTNAAGITLVNIVEGNKSNFSNIDYCHALLAGKDAKFDRSSKQLYIGSFKGKTAQQGVIKTSFWAVT
jgi:hypothetical protein